MARRRRRRSPAVSTKGPIGNSYGAAPAGTVQGGSTGRNAVNSPRSGGGATTRHDVAVAQTQIASTPRTGTSTPAPAAASPSTSPGRRRRSSTAVAPIPAPVRRSAQDIIDAAQQAIAASQITQRDLTQQALELYQGRHAPELVVAPVRPQMPTLHDRRFGRPPPTTQGARALGPGKVSVTPDTFAGLASPDAAARKASREAISGALSASQAARAAQRRRQLRRTLRALPANGPYTKALARADIRAMRRTGVDASLLYADQIQESALGTNRGPSSADARGVGQFIPGTRDSILAQFGLDAWAGDPSATQDAVLSQADLNEQALAQATYLKQLGAVDDPSGALTSYSGGYTDAEYNNPVISNAENFAALDKFGRHGNPGAPAQPQAQTVRFRGEDVHLGGPYEGSRALVRLITGSPHLRGDHGGTPFGEAPGQHAADGDHYRPDGYAQDINGDNPRENEPPFTQETLDTVVRNLRELGATDANGDPPGDIRIGDPDHTFEVQGYTVFVETSDTSHLHVGAHPTGPAPGSVTVGSGGIAAPGTATSTAPSGFGSAAGTVSSGLGLEQLAASRGRRGGVVPSLVEISGPAPASVPFASVSATSQPSAARDALSGTLDTSGIPDDRLAEIEAILRRAGMM